MPFDNLRYCQLLNINNLYILTEINHTEKLFGWWNSEPCHLFHGNDIQVTNETSSWFFYSHDIGQNVEISNKELLDHYDQYSTTGLSSFVDVLFSAP